METLQLWEIFGYDFEKFKEKMEKYLKPFSSDFSLTNQDLALFYNSMMYRYASSNIRYLTDNQFLSDLTVRLVNTFLTFKKQYNTLKDVLEQTTNELLGYKETETIVDTNSGNSITKNAVTPTVQNPSANIWNFTSSANKNDVENSFNHSKTRTVLDKTIEQQNKIQNLMDMQLENYISKFSNMFIQIY